MYTHHSVLAVSREIRRRNIWIPYEEAINSETFGSPTPRFGLISSKKKFVI